MLADPPRGRASEPFSLGVLLLIGFLRSPALFGVFGDPSISAFSVVSSSTLGTFILPEILKRGDLGSPPLGDLSAGSLFPVFLGRGLTVSGWTFESTSTFTPVTFDLGFVWPNDCDDLLS